MESLSGPPAANCSFDVWCGRRGARKSGWKTAPERVRAPWGAALRPVSGTFVESGCLGMQLEEGGKFHPRLNMGTRPIANKYCEGKMKSTLKKE